MVTKGGNEVLTEPLAIRPTSETIIGYTYARWVQSYRDLPLLYNQWCNVVRWEKRTRPFLRTSEFLWQEGHTVHRTEEEAEQETMLILREVYQDFIEQDLAIPVIPGRKTDAERFAGALRTYSLEAMMGDGKALQIATSHNLGQGFARSFGIQFQDADGERKYAWTTSWGASTRMIGGVIMTHGDAAGLRMPPRVAPIQVIIVPIWRKEQEREEVARAVSAAEQGLRAAGIRTRVDWREEVTPGYKYNDWELRGVPLRLEIGPRDVQLDQGMLVRRDTRAKEAVPVAALPARAAALLEELQKALYQQAQAFRERRTYRAETFAQLQERMSDRDNLGFVEAWWCGDAACEAAIKAQTQATIRNIPLDQPGGSGHCIFCTRAAQNWVVFAKAY